ncbi:MAG: ATP-binding protein [Streptosporangiaceae bacterium]
MYQRHLRRRVERALTDTPAVFVAGPRQAGKTTLVHLIRHDGYATLDRATTRAGAESDPDGFVAGLEGAVALDEVQRVPDLLLAVKLAIDENRQPGRFLLTGSANVLMLPTVADALPGRIEIAELWPLSQGEIDDQPDGFIDAVFGSGLGRDTSARLGREEPVERVLRGGFPQVVQRAADRRADWFESYLTLVVEREVRDLSNIGNVAEIMSLIRLVAARSGSLFNLADVARGVQLPQSTARRYLGLLRAVFLVVDVPAWATNQSARVVKAPKLFLSDSGLASHLLGVGPERLAADPHLVGPLLEGFVAMELRKQLAWSRVRPTLSHFRTRRGYEVDLVMEARDGGVVGVEVKASATVRDTDFAGLRALASLTGERFRRGVVLHNGDEVVPFGRKLVAAPLHALWRSSATGP